MNIRIENWMGHEIRFVEKTLGDWWAVAVDVTRVLGIRNNRDAVGRLPDTQKDVALTDTLGGKQEVAIISEKAVYRMIMRSRRKEAEAFQDWVFDIIKQLRQSTGLEGFQIFRMLDKDHQKEAMGKLCSGLRQPVRVDFIKANTIANKAISSMHGHPKMIKKDQMTPEMLVERQAVLEDAVNLMTMSDKFKLDIAVSRTIYDKYLGDHPRNKHAN
ncbi:Bro-N domain-containing protein [Paenibacillus polymyxa]|uniref:BRO-N domain-containing protein n=1 Tax=Paenibacillus TaxID=44249 RepID=UPI000845D9EE|nr:BRO family protein [Paenibacillus polymyxa]AOK88509.1 antirepressor [Paenibacillus polymyxa]